jgi:hypothetical protein
LLSALICPTALHQIATEAFVFAAVSDGLSTNAAVFPQRALPMAHVVVHPKLGSFRAA